MDERTGTSLAGPGAVISCRGLSRRFGGTLALHDVDFDLLEGEVHGLVGANGAGKSTLVNILGGQLRPDNGMIELHGQVTRHVSARQARAAGISVIPQHLHVVPGMTVGENLFLNDWPRRAALVDWKLLHEGAHALLAQVGLDLDSRTRMGDLSYVEQQLVSIARAFLVQDAKVIILDEPTGPLVRREIELLFSFIRRFRAEHNASFVYISHFIPELFEICDRASVFRDGQVVGVAPMSEWTIDSIVESMVGPGVTLYPDRRRERGETILSVQGMASPPLLTDVNFDIASGEIVGIAGLKGSGRTELLRAVCGMDRASSGVVSVSGRPVKLRSYRDALRAGLGLLPEDRLRWGVFAKRSVRENVSITMLKRVAGRSGLISPRLEKAMVSGLVDKLSIKTASIESPVERLSGGNQQKVVLAKLLSCELSVYLLDEPTLGIDVGAKAQVHALVYDLAERGAGVVVVSSDPTELAGLCDRVLILRDGAIVEQLRGQGLDPTALQARLEEVAA